MAPNAWCVRAKEAGRTGGTARKGGGSRKDAAANRAPHSSKTGSKTAVVRENGNNLVLVRRYRGVSATIFCRAQRFAMMTLRVECSCHAHAPRVKRYDRIRCALHYERAFMTSISNSSPMCVLEDETSSAAQGKHTSRIGNPSHTTPLSSEEMARNATGEFLARFADKEGVNHDALSLQAKVVGSAMRASLQRYESAMRQMEVRFEVLDRDLSLKKNRNPIHHIESRVKNHVSIYEKLKRRNLPVSVESMEANIFDIAGVRVICSYIHDVYGLLSLLRKQDDLEIVEVKDYIEHPKPNGYRSLHVIVRMPVYFMDKKELVPVEVQIRTIAMDFWASLEHGLKYKAVHSVEGIDSSDELLYCSRVIKDVEERMQILARAMDTE